MTRDQATESLAHIITAIILLDEVDWDGITDAIDFQQIINPNHRDPAELAHFRDIVRAARVFQSTVADLELARMQAGAP